MSDRAKKMLVSAVAFVAVWNVAKLVIQQFITHEGYHFSILDIVVPLVVSLAVDVAVNRSKGQ